MFDFVTFIAFWIIVTFIGAVGVGKWLKRQRLQFGGPEPWDEEWSK